MLTCQHCSAQVGDDDTFCRRCGTPLRNETPSIQTQAGTNNTNVGIQHSPHAQIHYGDWYEQAHEEAVPHPKIVKEWSTPIRTAWLWVSGAVSFVPVAASFASDTITIIENFNIGFSLSWTFPLALAGLSVLLLAVRIGFPPGEMILGTYAVYTDEKTGRISFGKVGGLCPKRNCSGKLRLEWMGTRKIGKGNWFAPLILSVISSSTALPNCPTPLV